MNSSTTGRIVHQTFKLTAMAAAVTGTIVCLGCGGGGSPSAPEAGTGTNVVTITASGASPRSLTVPLGSQVTFVNNDSDVHLMYSDPHPDHTDCPELNQVGSLERGQTRQSGNLNTARSCGFHDHNQPLNTALRGTILIR